MVAALFLFALEVARHPASIEGNGKSFLVTDVSLLLLYGAAGIWVWLQGRAQVSIALSACRWIGLAAGAVLVANHVIEMFVANRPFVLVIAPVMLIFALLGAAGSVAWERTRSLAIAAIAGLWCAIIAMLVLICFVLAFNLAFEHSAELWLRGAFLASGTNDEGAFLTKNTLEAASEGLVRLPIMGLLLSIAGALLNFWISGRTRITARVFAWITPILLAVSLAALWHANTLERSARPPFVMFGVMFAGIALCSAHAVWSVLRRKNT